VGKPLLQLESEIGVNGSAGSQSHSLKKEECIVDGRRAISRRLSEGWGMGKGSRLRNDAILRTEHLRKKKG